MPYKFLQKTWGILLMRQTNILSAAVVIMATVFLSQIFGLIKSRLLTSTFGATRTVDIYLASTRIPDAIFQILIAGALSSSFIPVFSQYLENKNEEEAKIMTSSLFFLGIVIFSVFGLALLFFPDQISYWIAPGFTGQEIVTMGQLVRIMVVVELLFIMGAFFSAILQSYNHFFIPGIAAALYNLGIIIGIVFLSGPFGIFGAAYGGVIGAIVFVAVQFVIVKKIGFSLSLVMDFKNKGVKEVVRLMWPRTIGLGINQVGLTAILRFASFLAGGVLHYF